MNEYDRGGKDIVRQRKWDMMHGRNVSERDVVREEYSEEREIE